MIDNIIAVIVLVIMIGVPVLVLIFGSGGSKVEFDRVFTSRLGRDPARFIEDKLRAGSTLDDTKYEYEIISAEIQHQSGYAAPPFNTYLSYDLMKLVPKPKLVRPLSTIGEEERGAETVMQMPETPHDTIDQDPAPVIQSPGTPEAKICVRELLQKQQFLELYRQSLWNLAHDRDFMRTIDEIQAQYAGVEFSPNYNDKAFLEFKRRAIPLVFTKNCLNADPDYLTIEKAVVGRRGSPTSAMISVYYALRLYQIGHSGS